MSGDDSGFTLPELIIGIFISGIIIGSIIAAIFIGFTTADASSNRLVVSHDLQLASTYFESDVQNADLVCRLPDGTALPCITGSSDADHECVQAGDSMPFLQFRWLERDQNPPSTVEVVDYVVNGTTIVREECTGADFKGGDLTLKKSAVVVHQLTGSPVVTCAYATAPKNPNDACATDAPMHLATGVTVKLTSTATSKLGAGPGGSSGFTDTASYTLQGSRRSGTP